jgi:hypothetical protein
VRLGYQLSQSKKKKGFSMKLEVSKDEQQQLLACIEAAVKAASNSLQAAAILLPLASKIQQLSEDQKGD